MYKLLHYLLYKINCQENIFFGHIFTFVWWLKTELMLHFLIQNYMKCMNGSLFYVDDFIYNGYIRVIFGIIESTPFYSNEHGDDHSPSDCCSINQTHPVTLNTLGAAIAASSSIPLSLFSSQYLIP